MTLLKSKIPFYYKNHDATSHFHYHKNITSILIKVHNKINEFLIFYYLMLHILYIMLLKSISLYILLLNKKNLDLMLLNNMIGFLHSL